MKLRFDPQRNSGGRVWRATTAPRKAAKTAADARILSYREEAAELLAGSTERRRRRTIGGRPAGDRDRGPDQPRAD